MSNNELSEKTIELLSECKKAGYEVVTVLVRDEKVPASVKAHSGVWFGDVKCGTDNDGIAEMTPIKVICGIPHRYGKHRHLLGDQWPLMWDVVHECELTAGLGFGGCGLGDCHEINPLLLDKLTPGCYDLNSMECLNKD